MPPSNTPQSDIAIRDGQAAIEFRTYYSGTSVISATSPGLSNASVTITSQGSPAWNPGVTPPTAARPYARYTGASANANLLFALNRPTSASSTADGSSSALVNDGDATTFWQAATAISNAWWQVDLENTYQISTLQLTFPTAGNYAYQILVSPDGAAWTTAVDQSQTSNTNQTRTAAGDFGAGIRFVRVVFTGVPAGKVAGLKEVVVGGGSQVVLNRNQLGGDHATTTPVTQDRDHATYDWQQRYAEVLARHQEFKPDVVIFSDSIIHYWGGEPKAPKAWSPETWAKCFAGFQVSNLGFGWDCTENVLWRIDHGELDGIKPKVIVIKIGTNNTAVDNSPEDIAAGIEAICAAAHAKQPAAKILLLGILPRHDEKPPRPAITEQVNTLLAARLLGVSWLTFRDFGGAFRGPDGVPDAKLFRDGVHLNGAGYEILGAKIREQLLTLTK